MLKKSILMLKISILFLVSVPLAASANPVTIKAARWTKVDNVKYCSESKCETFRNIELDTDIIDLGQVISVTNLDTGMKIISFQVKRIRYGRKIQMCWLGETEGINEGTYITVGGCNQN